MKAIKNGIPLKLQWILLFIPFINMLIIPIYIWNFAVKSNDIKHLFPALGFVFGVVLFWFFLDIILSAIFQNQNDVFEIIDKILHPYLIPLTLGLVLILNQKKFL